jgi:hypothetical protein
VAFIETVATDRDRWWDIVVTNEAVCESVVDFNADVVSPGAKVSVPVLAT